MPGHQEVGVLRIQREAGAAGVRVDEEDALPGLAAILGAEDAALFLRPGEAAGDAGVDGIGIGGVDDDAPDAAALHQPHVLPGGAGVGGFVDAVALMSLSRMAQASPVPAQTVLGSVGATASAPMACEV